MVTLILVKGDSRRIFDSKNLETVPSESLIGPETECRWLQFDIKHEEMAAEMHGVGDRARDPNP